MFTQTIKRWLNKLFAWWPWKRSSVIGYSQAVGMNNATIAPEQIWRTTMEGPAAQPGTTSIAVEHAQQDDGPPAPRSTTDERPERKTLSSPPPDGPLPASLLPATTGQEPPASSPRASIEHAATAGSLSPTEQTQRRLEFMRYLVQRGIVNEDFPEGQLPEQYRRQAE